MVQLVFSFIRIQSLNSFNDSSSFSNGITIDISNYLDKVNSGREAINNYSNNYWDNFKINFQEELVIDKISDVFLESIVINNPAQANKYNNLYIAIDIQEFNIKTTTNNIFMKDKFVLPNENTEVAGSNKIMKYHLKSNYIATITPQKLNSLTFKITNENNEGVNTHIIPLVTSSGNVLVQGTDVYTGYSSGANKFTVSNLVADAVNMYDAIYNSDKLFLGIVTGIDISDPLVLHMVDKTHMKLIHGEKLYICDSDIRTGVLTNGIAAIDSTSITVDGTDATTVFNEGDKVFIGNGSMLGTIKISDNNSAITSTNITFEESISISVPDNVRLYKESPLPRIFASDTKTNRMILEFVFISR